MNDAEEVIVPFQPVEVKSDDKSCRNDLTDVSREVENDKNNKKQTKATKYTEVLEIPQDEQMQIIPHVPRPPLLPRSPGLGKGIRKTSLDEKVRGRRLRSSQESLTDQGEMCSSNDSLNSTIPAPGSPMALRNGINSADTHLTHFMRESPPVRDRCSSLCEEDKLPRSRQLPKPGKIVLSPLQLTRTFPPLESCISSLTLRSTNQIDRDCLDYNKGTRSEKLQRNLSDSRLWDTMVSDNTSVNSMKSNFSVLNPIRPKDVRNR